MRAAILREYGADPELGEWDDPEPGDGRLAVDVLAGGLNPVDLLTATGTYPRGNPPVPSVLGREGVVRLTDGRAAYVGAAVAPFGTFAERTLIEESAAIPIPDGLDPALAVCFGIAGLAGWLALEHQARLRRGETVLVLGASSIVGQVAVQGAKLLGAGRVVGAARSPDGLERARELGADATVRLDAADDLTAALRDATGGDGADVIVDPLWGAPAVAALGAAAEHARFVQIGSSAGQEATIAAAPVRNTPLTIIGHTNFAIADDVIRAAYVKMADHAARGELTADVERVPLDDVADAWRRQQGGPGRKLAIVP